MLKNFFSSKKPENEDYPLIVTFYFVSGSKMDVEFSAEKLDVLMAALSKGWNTVCSTSPLYGINLSLVTHYTVKNR